MLETLAASPAPRPAFVPPQDLSWAAQKSKEDVLTLAVLEHLNNEFAGTGGQLKAELDVHRRLRQDFVLTLPTGERVTIEAKFEDYPLSLFPEVLQLVKRRDGTRWLEPGWAYKTTAHFLLYISPVSGRAVLVARQRVLELQVLLLQDVLLQSARYDYPVLLNAALNPAEQGQPGISRAGVGLGLLLKNVLDAYRLRYGNDGLYEFDLTPALRLLKTRLLAEPGHAKGLMTWASSKLLAEPFTPGTGLTEASELGWMLALNPTVNQGLLSAVPMPAFAYKFFQQAASAGLASGQTWLFSDVAGQYCTAAGALVPIATPVDAALGTRHRGRKLNRGVLQQQSQAQLAALFEPVEQLAAKRQAYLAQVATGQSGQL